MSEPLPKFDAPPVIETVLGVQFAPLAGYTTPMAGWFWKSYLPLLSDGAKWEKATDAIHLDDSFERFGDNEFWGQVGFRIGPTNIPNRVQIIHADEQRMVQVQDTRFVLNWRRRDGSYPSFDILSQDFWKVFPAFEKFAKESGLGEIVQNQWEVTYVNRIPKSELWKSAADLVKIVPGISLPSAVIAEPSADPLSLDWRFVLPEKRGRLYIGLLHARSGLDPSAEEFMQITCTARGAVDREKGWDLRSGFDLGHEAIVRTFASMTSPEAHKIWKRRI